jgi:PKD repeat protein
MPICYLEALKAVALATSLLAENPPLPTQTSSFPNPTISFSTPGTKTVTLRVCNSGGCSSKTTTLQVLDPSPRIAAISGPAIVGTAQPTPTYTATTTGKPPLLRTWTLTSPDGSSTSSTADTVSLAPTLAGSYTVNLRASNFSGTASSSLPVSVVPNVFADLAPDFWAASFINTFFFNGFTSGCGPDPLSGFPRFCPLSLVSRAELAVFLVRGLHPPPFQPPAARGVFADVPPSYWAAPWIEQLAKDGITAGCQGPPVRLFCPSAFLSRAEMAVLLIASVHGPLFAPPPATGVFLDVPASYWAARWIEQILKDGITGGCQGPPQRLFCPSNLVTRAEIAVFLGVAFRLTQAPRATSFQARLCTSSACTYPAGLPISFDVRVSGGLPAAYDYDWNGDGVYDQTTVFPVDHIFTAPGTYNPRLRVRLGSSSVVTNHPFPILISASSGFLAPPSNLSAFASSLIAPAAGDPPGTPFRIAYTLAATPPPGTLRGYAAYVSSGLTSTFAGLIPASGGSLLLPPAAPGTTRYLSLNAFTSTTKSSGSLAVRLP